MEKVDWKEAFKALITFKLSPETRWKKTQVEMKFNDIVPGMDCFYGITLDLEFYRIELDGTCSLTNFSFSVNDFFRTPDGKYFNRYTGVVSTEIPRTFIPSYPSDSWFYYGKYLQNSSGVRIELLRPEFPRYVFNGKPIYTSGVFPTGPWCFSYFGVTTFGSIDPDASVHLETFVKLTELEGYLLKNTLFWKGCIYLVLREKDKLRRTFIATPVI